NYSLIIGTKVLIVLSSDQATKDPMDNVYYSKPEVFVLQDLHLTRSNVIHETRSVTANSLKNVSFIAQYLIPQGIRGTSTVGEEAYLNDLADTLDDLIQPHAMDSHD